MKRKYHSFVDLHKNMAGHFVSIGGEIFLDNLANLQKRHIIYYYINMGT